jgi:hypothetical protein
VYPKCRRRRFPACVQLTKSFFPYGGRHGEESQEGEEDNEKEKQEEVVEPTHSFVRGRQTSCSRAIKSRLEE